MNLFEGLKSDWIYINGFRRIIGAVGKFDRARLISLLRTAGADEILEIAA